MPSLGLKTLAMALVRNFNQTVHTALPELFARWMQFGALMPFCRGHTETGSRGHEPWAFGAETESISRSYLQLRYRLLPYLYSLFWHASQTGVPILRPLFFEFPADQRCFTLEDQVMLGPFLMAAPVTKPGIRMRDVYFPAGHWYDWWSERVVEGPARVSVAAPLERMPLFARAGAILPLGPDRLQHTGEYRLSPLTLHLYPGDGAFTLYEDDGQTHEHERGEFCTTRYAVKRQGHTLQFSIEPRRGAYRPPERELVLVCDQAQATLLKSSVGQREHAPVRLTDDGQARRLNFRLR